MSKSNYTYEITEFAGKQCMIITDQGGSHMSVTNNIENVVKEISDEQQIISPDSMIIVYRDSEGIWDGWDHSTQTFVPLQCENQWHAIRRFVKYLGNPIINNKTKEVSMMDPNQSADTAVQEEELATSPGPGKEEEEEEDNE